MKRGRQPRCDRQNPTRIETRHRCRRGRNEGGSLTKTFSVLAVFGMTVTPLARFAAAVAVLPAAGGPLHAPTITFDVRRPALEHLSFENLWNTTLHDPALDARSACFHREASACAAGATCPVNPKKGVKHETRA